MDSLSIFWNRDRAGCCANRAVPGSTWKVVMLKRWSMVLRCAVDQGNHIMDSGLRETRRSATGQKRVPMDL